MKILTIISLLLLASLPTPNVWADDKIPPSVLAVPGGRFVFGQISNSGEDRYLLDTQTGRMWVLAVSPTREILLVPIHFRAHDLTETVVPSDSDNQVVEKTKEAKSK